MSRKKFKRKRELTAFERELPAFSEELLKLDPEMKAIYTPGEGLSNVSPEVAREVEALCDRLYDKVHPKRFLEKWNDFEAHVDIGQGKATYQLIFYMGGRVVVELVFRLLEDSDESVIAAMVKELADWSQAHANRKPGTAPRYKVDPEGPLGKPWTKFIQMDSTAPLPAKLKKEALIPYVYGCLSAWTLIRDWVSEGDEGLAKTKELRTEIGVYGSRRGMHT